MKKSILLLALLTVLLIIHAAGAEALYLPESLTVIEDEAYLGCDSVKEIYIPSTVVTIGRDALPPQVLVYCEPGSAAEAYAKANGLEYSYMEQPQFEEKSREDFPSGTLLDYGGKGFAVLQENVKEVNGAQNGDLYTVYAETEIHEGDSLYIPGLKALIKAQKVTDHGDGSYTVSSDSEAGMESFFQYINYQTSLDAVASQTRALRGASRDTEELARYTGEYALGFVRAGVSIGASVDVCLRYDASLFGKGYLEFKACTNMDAGITVSVEKEYTLDKEWPLFQYTIPTDIPFLVITLDMSLPVEVSARAQAEASAQISACMGCIYKSYGGLMPVQECDAHWDLTAGAEMTCRTGPKAAMGISLLRFLTASVSAQAGCDIKAETSLLDAHSGEETPDEIHACTLCFDTKANVFTTLDVGLSALGENLGEHNLYSGERSIFDGYLSMINEEESPLGGRITMAEGTCPNRKYRATLQVTDPDEQSAVKQVAVHRRVNQTELALVENGVSPLTVYLYPGPHTAESDHLGHPEFMNFDMSDRPQEILMDFTLVPIDEEHFPDDNFRQFVAKHFDPDHDLKLSAWEREQVTVIDPYTQDEDWREPYLLQMYSLEGIRYFNALEGLIMMSCARIKGMLDLSHNTELNYVFLQSPISELNINGCDKLEHLGLELTWLEELDITTNTRLIRLTVNGPYTGGTTDDSLRFRRLIAVNNPCMKYLTIENYPLFTELDISCFPNVESIMVMNCGVQIIYPEPSSIDP